MSKVPAAHLDRFIAAIVAKVAHRPISERIVIIQQQAGVTLDASDPRLNPKGN